MTGYQAELIGNRFGTRKEGAMKVENVSYL